MELTMRMVASLKGFSYSEQILQLKKINARLIVVRKETLGL